MHGDLVVVRLASGITHGVHAADTAADGSLHGQCIFCGLRLAGPDREECEPRERSNYHELANGTDVTCRRCRQSPAWWRRHG